ncbi:MAG: polysaccharide deacetylase family protein [Pseudomonadota bacterium]|nr:polysaccharide deacetylase family protein [Pseudomonadota bacterium]
MSASARISILMYHQVGEFAPMKAHRANYCDQGRFASQMGFLSRFGYRVLDLDDALRCLRGEEPVPPRAVVLTFDDAYEGFIEYALPALERYGFPATVYAISGYLGRRAEWFAKDPGRPVPRLMSPEQIREIRRHGIGIGSHTANHLKLGKIPPAVQQDELTASKAALEDLLGEEIRHLCYPYGSFDLEAVRAAAKAGYASATSCLRGPAEPVDHPLLLPRKAISFGDNLLGYLWKLSVKNTPKPKLVEWRRRLAAEPLC